MTKDIEGEFSLGEKFVPKEVGEGAGENGKYTEEVGFKGLYGALGGIAAMDVRRH